jgi:hypothetical protein
VSVEGALTVVDEDSAVTCGVQLVLCEEVQEADVTTGGAKSLANGVVAEAAAVSDTPSGTAFVDELLQQAAGVQAGAAWDLGRGSRGI